MLDTRFVSDRMNFTETTCDRCDDTILASEPRATVTVQWQDKPAEDRLLCFDCVVTLTA